MPRPKNGFLGIITDPEVGTEYVGKVKSIVDFGAFVEILPGKEGLLHISEISWERLETMQDVFEEGEEVKVKLIEFDERNGKLRLSRKVLLEKPEGYVERPPRERRDSRGGDRRGGRDNRGRGRDDRRGGRDNRNRNNRNDNRKSDSRKDKPSGEDQDVG